MPEIGEVARIVHYLRKHLVNKTIANVRVQEDDIVYGKVGTTAAAFQKAVKGKKVLDARQQGKYFWLVLSSPPHPLMHFGMSGWMKFSNDDTAYYRPKKEEEEEWPPKYWKFVLEADGKGDGKCEVAFVDPRRLARVRLVDAKAEDMRMTSPLKENGPDPVQDKDVLTYEWLCAKMRSKKVPVKALLLDQANMSGVGNWVADEVLYQARIHPEQYSNTFSDEQLQQLHDSLMNVCTTAVETLAESSKFPETWLMRYRWDKGKKNGNKLPNGEKIVHLKVGGRTSAVVPSVQKKTGAVAGDVSKNDQNSEGGEEEEGEEEVERKKPTKGRKRKAKAEQDDDAEEDAPAPTRSRARNPKKTPAAAEEEDDEPKPANTKKPSKANGTAEEAKPPRRRTASRASKKIKAQQDGEQADSGAEADTADANPAAGKPANKKRKEDKANDATTTATKKKQTKAATAAKPEESQGRRRSTRTATKQSS
ncbi:hypothetical protein LTR50_006696 [Elasticomyces elasticus]|nr:hypothetical protein LTR50_006696 [Elasticomyces elasticus]